MSGCTASNDGVLRRRAQISARIPAVFVEERFQGVCRNRKEMFTRAGLSSRTWLKHHWTEGIEGEGVLLPQYISVLFHFHSYPHNGTNGAAMELGK